MGPVSHLDLIQPIRGGDRITGWTIRHVAKADRILVVGRRPLEVVEGIVQTTLSRLEARAGVVGNHRNDKRIPALASEVPCSVDRVHASVDEIWRVADVMQPRSCRKAKRVQGERISGALGASADRL